MIAAGGHVLPVRVRRYAVAKGYRLSFDAGRRELRLSIPARANIAKALRWAQEQTSWVETQLAVTPNPITLAPGVVFPLEGRDVTIDWQADGPRRVVLDGDRLRVGGPAEAVGPRILRWLKARAKAVLAAETMALAHSAALPLRQVGIGDPRSRWGSCATSGIIRYSWRLICTPPDVRRATVAHEVAHLAHMDHSPAFHARHAALYGADPAPARRWLKANGAMLHRIGA